MELGHSFSSRALFSMDGQQESYHLGKAALEQLGQDGGAWMTAHCSHFLTLGSSVLSAIVWLVRGTTICETPFVTFHLVINDERPRVECPANGVKSLV
jgi:hypothetical protein